MGCAQSVQAHGDGPAGAAQPPPQVKQADAVAAPAPPGKGEAQALPRDSPTSPLDVADGEDCCYKTESETDRLQSLLNCKCLDTNDERRFDAITNLLTDMFDVPMAIVSLIDDDRLVFKSAAGTDCRQGDRLHSFCDASLRAPNPTMMIVPDTLEDARFQKTKFVVGAPYIRFYSGAPLISSDGHVMGSLGIMDIKPRSFPAGALNVICNFAELVVREMERDKAAERKRAAQRKQEQAADTARAHTVRALSCFDDAVMLCNVSDPAQRWPLLYVNQEWCAATGQDETSCLTSGLWELFQTAQMDGNGGGGGNTDILTAAREGAAQAIKEGRAFEMVVQAPNGTGDKLSLQLHPATRDHLSLASPTIAIPNFVEGMEPEEVKAMQGLYFAVARRIPSKNRTYAEIAAGGSVASEGSVGMPTPPTSMDHVAKRSAYYGSSGETAQSPSVFSSVINTFGLECPGELAGLTLGPMLGRGAMGKVYRGTWEKHGNVAVKIVDMLAAPGEEQRAGPVVEALLSKRLSHPHIVSTYDFAVKAMESGEEAAHHRVQQQQLWMVQQYCEHGTLGDALDRGWLRHNPAPGSAPNMRAVLATALEIASAMKYLHVNNVLHGDLTPGNVLLTAPPSAAADGPRRRDGDSRRFAALVGDFGLSRVVEEASQAQLKTNTFGTVSHMPLELIEGQLLTPAVDVFAFGVLLWEMYSGHRAWAGKSAVQILYARTARKERLRIPSDMPSAYKALVERCLHDNHVQRPHFKELTGALSALLDEE